MVDRSPTAPPAELKAFYTAEYRYDPAGNRLEKRETEGVIQVTEYTYDAQNRLNQEKTDCKPDPVDYLYDPNGNQITRTEGNSVESYGYDYANRLESYIWVVAATTEKSFVYAYMPTGQRLNKQDLLADTTEFFASDGDDVIDDFTQTGSGPLTRVRTYVQTLAIDSKLVRLDLDSGGNITATHWYVPDAIGSVHQILDDVGDIENINLTTAWGEPLDPAVFTFSNALADRYGFSPRERDGETWRWGSGHPQGGFRATGRTRSGNRG